MESTKIRIFRIPPILFDVAEKPIGQIPVTLDGSTVAETGVNDSGEAVFVISSAISDRIDKRELQIFTVHIKREVDATSGLPKLVKILGLQIAQPANSESL
jgi:hypothetical protein